MVVEMHVIVDKLFVNEDEYQILNFVSFKFFGFLCPFKSTMGEMRVTFDNSLLMKTKDSLSNF